MSKIYQPIKNNPYRLRDSVYYWTVTDIRDVGRYLQGYYDEDFIKQYAPTADTINAVLQAKEEIPEAYRDIVFDNTAFEIAIPAKKRNKTTTLKKARFIQRVAELTGRPLGAREIVHVEYDWR